MRMFWTVFFLGSMLLVGLDVRERREQPIALVDEAPMATGPEGAPTPRP
jgi:hypothetical protein